MLIFPIGRSYLSSSEPVLTSLPLKKGKKAYVQDYFSALGIEAYYYHFLAPLINETVSML